MGFAVHFSGLSHSETTRRRGRLGCGRQNLLQSQGHIGNPADIRILNEEHDTVDLFASDRAGRSALVLERRRRKKSL